MRRFIPAKFWLTVVVATAVVHARPSGAEAEVRAVLDAQVAAWNRGDLDGFMQGYWDSSKTTFAGSSGILCGWQEVLERYRRNYPDRRSMGTLTFSHLEVTFLSPRAALVLGRWQLQRASDRPGGAFTLVLRRLPQGWHHPRSHFGNEWTVAGSGGRRLLITAWSNASCAIRVNGQCLLLHPNPPHPFAYKESMKIR